MAKINKKHESVVTTYSSEASVEARRELFDLMNKYPATPEEKERSLGLFLRGSLLARIMAIAEIYQQIVKIPGIVIDLGTWRGQTAVLCENLRSIYEPLHFNRRIVCFDTFVGYTGFSSKDKPTQLHKNGTYGLGGGSYAGLLRDLLLIHEKNNAMGHYNGKHKVIEGDCRLTLPKFFKENANEFVSLAFFDVNAFEPTLKSFELIYEKLVPGGHRRFLAVNEEFDSGGSDGLYAENFDKYPHTIFRSTTYPGLCYLKK